MIEGTRSTPCEPCMVKSFLSFWLRVNQRERKFVNFTELIVTTTTPRCFHERWPTEPQSCCRRCFFVKKGPDLKKTGDCTEFNSLPPPRQWTCWKLWFELYGKGTRPHVCQEGIPCRRSEMSLLLVTWFSDSRPPPSPFPPLGLTMSLAEVDNICIYLYIMFRHSLSAHSSSAHSLSAQVLSAHWSHVLSVTHTYILILCIL